MRVPLAELCDGSAKLDDFCASCLLHDCDWILKEANTNNALGVRLVPRDSVSDTLAAMVEAGRRDGCGDNDTILQRYISRPLLLRGRKFHIRVNVLARGYLQVRMQLHGGLSGFVV